jgi:cell wall-associated NlpC family hydrolase
VAGNHASPFAHESEGLNRVKAVLPHHAPFRAWSHFEFRDGHGKWHEVDLLVLGRRRLHGNNVAGSARIPTGLVIDGSPAGLTAVRFAIAQLGKPYVIGAAGPDALDCSELTMAAWARAGVALPPSAHLQALRGTPVPADLSLAIGGDVVFIPGADGTAAAPGHVGMVLGRAAGRVYLIQAPQGGIPVEIIDAAEWAGQIVAVRHSR